MMPTVTSLHLRGFRSIVSADIGFDNPLFLVGRNGAGKSNVARAITLLADVATQSLETALQAQGGVTAVHHRAGEAASVGLAVELSLAAPGEAAPSARTARYAFEFAFDPDGRLAVMHEQCILRQDGGVVFFDRDERSFRSNVASLAPAPTPQALVLPLVAGQIDFAPVARTLAGMRVYHLDPEAMRRPQRKNGMESLRRDGSNVASVLSGVRAEGELQAVREFLAAIVPNLVRLDIWESEGYYWLLFEQDLGRSRVSRFSPNEISDGALRVLGLLAAIYQPATPSLILVEDPEATIHPGAMGTILDIIREGSRRTQLVVTTHSPEVLDGKWIHADNLRVVVWDEGATRIARVADDTRATLEQHLLGAGEMLRSNSLDPLPTTTSPRPLFEALD